jgi:heptosyltransferase II
VLYYLLAGIGYMLAALPESVLAACCRPLGWLVATVPSRRRRTLRANLHHVFPDKTEAWRRKVAVESARRSLEMVVFVLAAPYFSKARLQRQFPLDENFRRMLDEHQAVPGPLVVLSPHFSLMEANTLVPMLYGKPLPPMAAIYRPLDVPGMERWVKATRERWGLRLLSRKAGFFQAIELLRHNGAVVVLFDQNAGNRGALTLFCGRVCSTTELAGLLVEKCQARTCFIYPERRGFLRATIRGEYLVTPPGGDAVLFAANRWLEEKLRSSQEVCPDWLWLHSRWRHQDEPGRRFRLESKRNLLAPQLASLGLAAPPRCTRFFIRLPNWLGDVVMALPLLRALRKGRPDAELTLLAPAVFKPLLEKLGVGDRVLAVPAKGAGQRKFFRGLREEYPDTYILFTNSLRGDLGAKAAGAPQRFGMTRPGKWRPLLTHEWRVPEDLDETTMHQTRVWEKFFQHFGLREELDLTAVAGPSERAQQDCASAIKPSSATNQGGLLVGFICGTENFPEKRWPVALWRELVQAILAVRADARIILFGTTNDMPITKAVADGFSPTQVINRAGQTTLVEFADALGDCAVIICNDTGGMHLANLLGVPVIALYGPTNPLRTGPIFNAPRVILQPPGGPPTGGAPLAKLTSAQVVETLQPWLG